MSKYCPRSSERSEPAEGGGGSSCESKLRGAKAPREPTCKRARLAPAVALAAIACGCHSGEQPLQRTGTGAAPPASAAPVDRLAPDELAQGKAVVFGFPVPRSMTVERLYPDAAHIVGSVSPESLANYVRQRVDVQHVEIGAARTVFPAARIKGDPTHHTYRMEIVAGNGRTQLVIRDITPPPTVQGISEAERWKRAGLTPDGKIIDPRSLE